MSMTRYSLCLTTTRSLTLSTLSDHLHFGRLRREGGSGQRPPNTAQHRETEVKQARRSRHSGRVGLVHGPAARTHSNAHKKEAERAFTTSQAAPPWMGS